MILRSASHDNNGMRNAGALAVSLKSLNSAETVRQELLFYLERAEASTSRRAILEGGLEDTCGIERELFSTVSLCKILPDVDWW
jgi:hypothetical protein